MNGRFSDNLRRSQGAKNTKGQVGCKKKEERMDTGVFNQKAAHLISRGSRSESWKQDVQKYLSVPGSEQFA